jgi:hypothetical protein
MMFKATVLASLMAMASAFVPHDGIPVDSEIGQRLMNKARALEQQNQDQSWLTGYSIKYLGCTALVQVKGDAQGQGGGQNQNNDNALLYTQNLVKFALCSKDTACGSCGNGVAQYVVPMNDFMDAWTESKMQAEEQACEAVRENCYCQNANDDQVCEAQCYATWGMDYCTEYANDQDFEIQRFMECGGASSFTHDQERLFLYLF